MSNEIVVLASGGLDSSLMGVMLRNRGWDVHSLFVDYGQLAAQKEWAACRQVHRSFKMRAPTRIRVPGYGRFFQSGLVHRELDVVEDAFLPGRNMLFLLCAAGYAVERGIGKIAIGLLNEEHHLFSDQTSAFLSSASECLRHAVGAEITIMAPLIALNKPDVYSLAKGLGLVSTYSCHRGGDRPCGHCISCREFSFLKG